MLDLKPTLFDLPPITRPVYEKGATIRQRWWAFHTANLHIYRLLRDMALELKRKGFKKCGIGLLWEKLRWEYFIAVNQGDEVEVYKFSNSHRAFYARFLMAREPELKDFFNVRPQPSQEDAE